MHEGTGLNLGRKNQQKSALQLDNMSDVGERFRGAVFVLELEDLGYYNDHFPRKMRHVLPVRDGFLVRPPNTFINIYITVHFTLYALHFNAL